MSQGSGKRGSHARVVQRVTEVHRWMLLDYSSAEMLACANDAAHGWHVSLRTIQTYIAKATAILEAEAARTRKKDRARSSARLNDLYRRMYEEGDFRGALMAEEKHIELHGLKEPARLEIIDPGEARRRLEEEIAQAIAEAESITEAASTGEGDRRQED